MKNLRKAIDPLLWGALGALLVFCIGYGRDNDLLLESREQEGLAAAGMGVASRERDECQAFLSVLGRQLAKEHDAAEECASQVFCGVCEGSWHPDAAQEQHEVDCPLGPLADLYGQDITAFVVDRVAKRESSRPRNLE